MFAAALVISTLLTILTLLLNLMSGGYFKCAECEGILFTITAVEQITVGGALEQLDTIQLELKKGKQS